MQRADHLNKHHAQKQQENTEVTFSYQFSQIKGARLQAFDIAREDTALELEELLNETGFFLQRGKGSKKFSQVGCTEMRQLKLFLGSDVYINYLIFDYFVLAGLQKSSSDRACDKGEIRTQAHGIPAQSWSKSLHTALFQLNYTDN